MRVTLAGKGILMSRMIFVNLPVRDLKGVNGVL